MPDPTRQVAERASARGHFPLPPVSFSDQDGAARSLWCGNATSKKDVARLFAGDRPTLVVTSPPYVKRRDYDRPIPCWDSMMMGAFDGHNSADKVQMLINLGVIHQKGQWISYWYNWLSLMQKSGWRIFAQYVWHKLRGVPRRNDGRLKAAHEFIFHINKSSVSTNDWVPTAQPGRIRKETNDYMQACGKKRKKEALIVTSKFKSPQSVFSLFPVNTDESSGHPAQMPVNLAAQIVRTWKQESSIVYDPFCGSGTTIHASQAEGVIGLGMEISPPYCAIAIERWNRTHPNMPASKVAS